MPSLPIRILVGLSIFAILAILDLRKNGRRATRWREYAFLFGCCGFAMLYGAINDQITSRISWEYFYYGKELEPVLGPQVPPDPLAMSWAAVKVGMQATWSAGLLLGAGVLIANNPRKGRSPLSYPSLLKQLPIVASITVFCSATVCTIGYLGGLIWVSNDFIEMSRTNLWRPRHFMATYGEHLGGYVGGVLGMGYTVMTILRRRASLKVPTSAV